MYTCTFSVDLRPGSEPLARARLTASYRSCLRSIIPCYVTSYHMQHVQATAFRPHSRSLELNISSKSRPGLFHPTFRRSDNANVNVGTDFKDSSEGLRINQFVFDLHAGDRVVSTQKNSVYRDKTRPERCFHNPSAESLDHCLR